MRPGANHRLVLTSACVGAAVILAVQAIGARTGHADHRPMSHDEAIQRITQIAATSQIARYSWRGRGVAPAGYVRGMAVIYARDYCKLKDGDRYVKEMAKADTGNAVKDAITHYRATFQRLGMSNASAGSDTLRHLFVLLIGLGMRESSGRYCEGRDRNAHNTTAETAEAGLFQVSYDSRTSSSLLPALFQIYRATPAPPTFLEIFKQGVHPRPQDLENFGAGPGRDFQQLEKESPAFAAEYAAVGLRNVRTHWGPIGRREAEVKPDCDAMLKKVQAAVDGENLCPLLQ